MILGAGLLSCGLVRGEMGIIGRGSRVLSFLGLPDCELWTYSREYKAWVCEGAGGGGTELCAAVAGATGAGWKNDF